jgi:hypothetical protein
MSRLLSVLVLSLILLSAPPSRLGAAPTPTVATAPKAFDKGTYAKSPLIFEPNRGQMDAAVKYLAHGPGYALYLTSTEMVLQPLKHSALKIKVLGGNPSATAEPLDPLPGISNYYLGSDPANWHTNIPNYQRVAFRSVYPGIDLIFYGNQRHLEYDVVVKPGADPNQVRLKFEDAEKIRTDRNGDLVIRADGCEIKQHKPVVYQVVNGRRRQVQGSYALHGANELAFKLGKYDHTADLVIDPLLFYSTYLGGSGDDYAYGIALDGSGNAYLTGTTNSTPALAPGSQVYSGTTTAAFVVGIDPQGAGLYQTYLGGLSSDTQAVGYAITSDSSGNVYVTGSTTGGFGVSSGVLQLTYGGGVSNGFVVKLAPSGGVLYATYLGGNGTDKGSGIAADSNGNAYVTGTTSGGTFPLANALQPTFGGGTATSVKPSRWTPPAPLTWREIRGEAFHSPAPCNLPLEAAPTMRL